MKIVEPSAKMIWCTKNPEQVIEEAGRTCYKSEDQINDVSASTFIRMILKRGHDSVLEHASASFRIITDRGITHEIVRHRLASYSQESTRYCNYGKEKFGNEITVVKPSGIDNLVKQANWIKGVEEAEKAYFCLLEKDCPPQVARSVLPTCLKTEIVMTCNFREWRHFLKLRMAEAAHPDIQIIANQIQDQLRQKAKTVFALENLE